MKKIQKFAGLIVIVGLLYSAIILSLIISSAKEQPANNAGSLVILGAQVRGNPPRPSPVLQERLDAALIYLESNDTLQIVVCGGQGKDEADSEANVMADYLVQHGIDDGRIIRESNSTRTKENLANAMKKADLGKTVIVSNDFHIYRAKMLAKRLGIKEVSGLAAKSETSAKYITYTREVIALGYGLIFDW